MVERGYIVTTTKSTRGTDQKNGQLKTKTYHVNDAVGGVVIGAIGADAASGAAGREGETAPDTVRRKTARLRAPVHCADCGQKAARRGIKNCKQMMS